MNHYEVLELEEVCERAIAEMLPSTTRTKSFIVCAIW
jgi:hypothetical protein